MGPGTSLSGTQVVLDASGSLDQGVDQVQFTLTGGSLNDAIIATASPTEYGWIASWNSTTVPDGSYTLQSVASDAADSQGLSTPVSVIVANQGGSGAPTTD